VMMNTMNMKHELARRLGTPGGRCGGTATLPS
jgi:hypothetical protein